MSDARPIGVFDSGVGGLSVLREIRRELPGESVLYVADSGYAPYGDRPATFIEDRADAIMDFLIARGKNHDRRSQPFAGASGRQRRPAVRLPPRRGQSAAAAGERRETGERLTPA